jgi:dTDP-4-dehydrorhamnose reductase
MSKKAVIFGPGWLGNKIQVYLEHNGYTAEMPDRLSGDIADPAKVRKVLELCKPDVVINAAGKTGRPNIDWCEASPENKRATILSNVTGPLVLADQCVQRGIPMVHLSSGCIFNGASPKERGFTEEDTPNPNSFYAQKKADADNLLKDYPVLILRIRMPVSGDVNPRNLIYKLSHYPRVIDVYNSVTVIDDLLLMIRMLVEKGKTGIYNAVNPTPVRHRDILAGYKATVDPNHTYELVPSEEIAKLATTGRSNCILNTDKLLADVPNVPDAPMAIQWALEEYAKQLKRSQ